MWILESLCRPKSRLVLRWVRDILIIALRTVGGHHEIVDTEKKVNPLLRWKDTHSRPIGYRRFPIPAP